MKVKCPECGRVFNLDRISDANDWYFGHDCEETVVVDSKDHPMFKVVGVMYVDREEA